MRAAPSVCACARISLEGLNLSGADEYESPRLNRLVNAIQARALIPLLAVAQSLRVIASSKRRRGEQKN